VEEAALGVDDAEMTRRPYAHARSRLYAHDAARQDAAGEATDPLRQMAQRPAEAMLSMKIAYIYGDIGI